MTAVRCAVALAACLVLGPALAACTYEDDAGPRPSAAGSSGRPGYTVPAKNPGVLAIETRNYAELERRLSTTTGRALLADSGPADGPSVGFRKSATVKTAGPHKVTAACVGIPHAQIYLSQDIKAGSQYTVLEIDCSETRTHVVQLAAGPVGAQLTRSDPNGAWTGAVAGLTITAEGGSAAGTWRFYCPRTAAGSFARKRTKNPSVPGKITGTERFVEPPVGFEPTTPALQERCSGQLS